MQKFRTAWFLLILLVLESCSLAGASRPSRFYVLSTEPGTATAGGVQHPLSIGIGPVFLPDILARPQIVTRTDSNRIKLAEFERWGGDLDKNLLRVLSQNLMQRLNSNNIVTYPWRRQNNPDLQISIRFFRFGGALGQEIRLAGIWQILDGKQGCQLMVRRFEFDEIPADTGYAAYVDALSRGVADLSQTLAGKLDAVTAGCSPHTSAVG